MRECIEPDRRDSMSSLAKKSSRTMEAINQILNEEWEKLVTECPTLQELEDDEEEILKIVWKLGYWKAWHEGNETRDKLIGLILKSDDREERSQRYVA